MKYFKFHDRFNYYETSAGQEKTKHIKNETIEYFYIKKMLLCHHVLCDQWISSSFPQLHWRLVLAISQWIHVGYYRNSESRTGL